MLTNYLKIALRNLRKNKLFSAINIIGLSLGLTCCILIFLFIQQEISFDRFHVHADNIYRITSDMDGPSGKSSLAVTPAPWAPLMKKDLPEIKDYVRVLKDDKSSVGLPEETQFYEPALYYADSSFFNIFSFALDRGNSRQALLQPNSVVLTRSAAQKYFGKADPIGRPLSINSFGRNFTVQVTAVAQDFPSNAHFKADMVVSLSTLGDLSSLWSFHMFSTYLLLRDHASPIALEQKMSGFVTRYIIGNPQADGPQQIHLQPLTSIHLTSHLTGELEANSDQGYIYIFSGIALFILLIACFNFINLSTARSFSRAREVGLRKAIGAARFQLIRQFMGETILMCILALIAAVSISFLLLPVFHQLSGRQLYINLTANPALIIFLLLLMIGVGLLAGFYPAIVLSSFRPVEVLKGKLVKSSQGVSLRKVLVVLQFAVSIVLVASTLIISRQVQFLKNKNLGFSREHMLVVTLPRNMDSNRLQTLETSLTNQKGIVSVAAASSIPSTTIPVNQVTDSTSDLSKAASMQMLFIDESFLHTMNMKVIAGRDFNPSFATDKTEGFVVNEEAVKKLGWGSPTAAIGKTFRWVQPSSVLKSGKIIGVVQNFNITPLKSPVQPLVLHYFAMRFQYLYVRFDPLQTSNIVPLIEHQFNAFYPQQAFEYTFLDDTLKGLYESETRLGKIVSYFSMLAIGIACLGILGLSLYSIQVRLKEIGIRKVMGASTAAITVKLIGAFLKPVLVAALLSIPVTLYIMQKWLDDFAYRINIHWSFFIWAILLVVLLSLAVMSAQSVKAAMSNPVKSLHAE